MPPLYQYPALARWEEFEMLCRDLWSAELSAHFQLYGECGSDQHGVDSYAIVEGGHYALQCKGKRTFPQTNLRFDDVFDTVNKAKDYPHKIAILGIATTASRETKIQDKVAILNAQQRESEGFEVRIFYWKEIQEMLSRHPSVATKYYPLLARLPCAQRIRIVKPETNCFDLEYDTWSKQFFAVSQGDDIVVRVDDSGICIDWNTRTYDLNKIVSVNARLKYIGLINLPIQMLLDVVQDYAPGDDIKHFRVSCDEGLEIITTVADVEIEGVRRTVKCFGSFHNIDGRWYDDNRRERNGIECGRLDRIRNESRAIRMKINDFVAEKSRTLGPPFYES